MHPEISEAVQGTVLAVRHTMRELRIFELRDPPRLDSAFCVIVLQTLTSSYPPISFAWTPHSQVPKGLRSEHGFKPS